jgi:hypothetical protein
MGTVIFAIVLLVFLQIFVYYGYYMANRQEVLFEYVKDIRAAETYIYNTSGAYRNIASYFSDGVELVIHGEDWFCVKTEDGKKVFKALGRSNYEWYVDSKVQKITIKKIKKIVIEVNRVHKENLFKYSRDIENNKK